MSSRYEQSRYEQSGYGDADLDDFRDGGGREREISLGTATILGIFFALALVCALFFGFGYTLGRKSAQNSTAAVVETTDPSESSTTAESGGSPKPAPGSMPAAQKQSASRASFTADAAEDAPAPPEKIVVRETPASHAAADAHQVPQPAVRPPAAAAVTAPATVPAGTAGSAVVQVAAVSHQEDADLLVGALKRKGYNVAVRQVPQDKLLHVQIGPFATKKDAVAMQQRLQTDGYNAIVK